MNLLDTASLVVTPNGYKASKLYSIIPSDGTGDMTFARTGDTATRVNSSGLIETVLANKPRLDYLGSTCPKLLLEPQRTNIQIRSQEIDDATYVKSNTTVVANNIAAPDGTTTADKLYPTTSGTLRQFYSTLVITNATVYTTSFFAKAGGKNWINMIGINGSNNARFNLLDGTVSTISVGFTATITPYGNGWYRCTLTGTSTSIIGYAGSSIINSETDTSVTANGTDGVYFWGLQVEAGAYATSYIPTTTASVTRNADSCLKTSATALIGQTEGTMFIHYNSSNVNVDGRILALSNGAFNNRIVIAEDTGRIRVVIYTSNALQVDLGYSSNLGSYTGNHKIAVSYANNYLIVYVDGVLKASVNTLTVPACNSIYIGNLEDGTNITSINGRVSSVALWKTRLQNSELATLTSL